MNIIDMHKTITSQYAHESSKIIDSACYAFTTQMIEHIKLEGENPMDYEVVICVDEFPVYTDDKLLVKNRIRLQKII